MDKSNALGDDAVSDAKHAQDHVQCHTQNPWQEVCELRNKKERAGKNKQLLVMYKIYE